MLLTIIQEELLEHIVSLRFLIFALLCIILMVVSAYVLTNHYAESLREYQLREREHQAQIGSYETGSWTRAHALWVGGMIVDKPPPKLMTFFRGVFDNTAKSYWFSAFTPRLRPEDSLIKDSLFQLFPVVDFGFIIGAVMSLLAIFSSCDSICGEKEKGTLRLIMSNAVPRHQILLGKWVAGYLVILLPFLQSLILCILIILNHPNVTLSSQDWLALGLIILISLVYLSLFFSLGIFVSTRAAKSAASVLTLLFIWVVFALAIPNISPYVAGWLLPTRTYEDFLEQQSYTGKDYDWHAQRAKYKAQGYSDEEAGKLLDAYHKEHYRRMTQSIANSERALKNATERQISLAQNISRLSPVCSFIYAATNLAGTGVFDKIRFEQEAERFKDEFVRYSEDKVREVETSLPAPGTQEYMKRLKENDAKMNFSDKPTFAYHQQPLEERIRASLIDISFLLLFNALFFMGAYLSFLKYDVR